MIDVKAIPYLLDDPQHWREDENHGDYDGGNDGGNGGYSGGSGKMGEKETKGDASLLAGMMKRREEERRKKEEGGFTTKAMRKCVLFLILS